MKELDRVVSAVETLKLVATHLHTPLDTGELESALDALKSAIAAGPVEKKPSVRPEEKPALKA